MKSGASGTTGSSNPLKRTWTAPAFTPARSRTSFSRTPVHLALPMAPFDHRQPEGTDSDLGGDDRPVPANVELVVRCEDRLIEHFERRFEQRRARALKDERPLLGKSRGDRPLVRPARQRELDYRIGQRRRRSQRQRRSPGRLENSPPGREKARRECPRHSRTSSRIRTWGEWTSTASRAMCICRPRWWLTSGKPRRRGKARFGADPGAAITSKAIWSKERSFPS